MKYIHPEHYEGLKFDSEFRQAIARRYVERNCLKCDLFAGKDHDFSECNVCMHMPILTKGKITCPDECQKSVGVVSRYGKLYIGGKLFEGLNNDLMERTYEF